MRHLTANEQRRELLMGREVGFLARRFGRELGCLTCGIGRAVDFVGRRWGQGGFDWTGEAARDAGEHICRNTTWNLTRKPERKIGPWEWAYNREFRSGEVVVEDEGKNARLRRIEEDLEAWAAKQGHEG